jgi:hypothetical protein
VARTSTTWVKGQVTNPKGRPKAAIAVREMAQLHGPAGIQRLAELGGLVRGRPGADTHQAQIQAINSLLDRGYGKPVQQLSADAASGPMVLKVTWAPALEDEEPATPLLEHEAAD